MKNIDNKNVPRDLQRAQIDLIRGLNERKLERDGFHPEIEGAIQSFELAFRMQSEVPDVLDLRIDDAIEVFAQQRSIRRPLEGLHAVGLGYVRLGQPATDLSGGEAQRVKLALGLAEKSSPTLYVLDEPTTGLHLSDIARLVTVLDHLVEIGHTVVVVEHHLDLIRHADFVIDMGPEAGPGGGQIVAAGTPEHVAGVANSHTGAALRRSGVR